MEKIEKEGREKKKKRGKDRRTYRDEKMDARGTDKERDAVNRGVLFKTRRERGVREGRERDGEIKGGMSTEEKYHKTGREGRGKESERSWR